MGGKRVAVQPHIGASTVIQALCPESGGGDGGGGPWKRSPQVLHAKRPTALGEADKQ